MVMDEEAAGEQVSVRLGRQDILDCPDPPQVVAVVYEAVLHHLIGSPQVMHDALIHVADLPKRPNVSVQVIPMKPGPMPGSAGRSTWPAARQNLMCCAWIGLRT